MSETNERLAGQLPLPFDDGVILSTAEREWYVELGTSLYALTSMMRKPTETRPFVYQVNFDLLCLGRGVGRVVAKGFGESGSLITFHDMTSFHEGVTSFEGRMRSGKVKWAEDQFPPANYDKRVELLLSGGVYRLD